MLRSGESQVSQSVSQPVKLFNSRGEQMTTTRTDTEVVFPKLHQMIACFTSEEVASSVDLCELLPPKRKYNLLEGSDAHFLERNKCCVAGWSFEGDMDF